MWHNWAAVLEVASELIKQMIHLQLVKSPSLGRVPSAGCLHDGGSTGME